MTVRAVADIILKPAALTAEAFAPFGDVIEIRGRQPRWINEGTCERFDDVAQPDVLAAGGRPAISIFRAAARQLPFHVKVLERHPLSSQAFVPLDGRPFLVVVAVPGDAALSGRIRAYRSSGTQGVNYRRNTWHHALLALERTSHFLVIDRDGAGENCDETPVDDAVVVVTA
jgi:ureidoglycolate lyase